eukprot:GHVP01066257.1.p1 GENE.GHVP01066257.1~~GHVP01066257.1.p1  ORF type:complete len:247 (+),score=45.89 GHVP01066257.1:174-914(+)
MEKEVTDHSRILFFAVVVGGDDEVDEPTGCFFMYAIPKLGEEDTYTNFMVMAKEKSNSQNLLIGAKACLSVGIEDCVATSAIFLPTPSKKYPSYDNSNPPKIGDIEATVCPGFAWETGNEGSREKPKSAIITGSDESFCGRIYQNDDGEYYAIKANAVDPSELYYIVLDKQGDNWFLPYAGQMEPDATTTPGPETSTSKTEDTTLEPETTTAKLEVTTLGPVATTLGPEDSAVFAASFVFLAICFV